MLLLSVWMKKEHLTSYHVDSSGKKEKVATLLHLSLKFPNTLEMQLVTAIVRTMKEFSYSWILFELSLQFLISSSPILQFRI